MKQCAESGSSGCESSDFPRTDRDGADSLPDGNLTCPFEAILVDAERTYKSLDLAGDKYGGLERVV